MVSPDQEDKLTRPQVVQALRWAITPTFVTVLFFAICFVLGLLSVRQAWMVTGSATFGAWMMWSQKERLKKSAQVLLSAQDAQKSFMILAGTVPACLAYAVFYQLVGSYVSSVSALQVKQIQALVSPYEAQIFLACILLATFLLIAGVVASVITGNRLRQNQPAPLSGRSVLVWLASAVCPYAALGILLMLVGRSLGYTLMV